MKIYRFKNQVDGSIVEVESFTFWEALIKARKWFKTTLVIALMR
jgi:hypothetical protein